MPSRSPSRSVEPVLCEGRVVIGWREYVALPDWDVPPIKTKADTGARTSAIDVAAIEELDDDRVRFEIVVNRTTGRRVQVEADVVRRTMIRSSFGQAHPRLIVRTRMRLGPVETDVELGLVCRRNMLCRMLLGRRALEGRFLVDSRTTYRFGRRRRSRPDEGAPPS